MAITVPSTEPSVAPQRLRTGGMQGVSPAQAAAPFQQVQELGTAVTRAGSALVSIKTKQQEERNTSQVLAAKAAFEAEEAKVITEAKNTRGINAHGLADKTMEWYRKASQDHLGKMENSAQKRAFERILAEKSPQIKANIYSHEVGEQRRAVNDTAKASVQSSIDLAAADFTNPDTLDKSILDISRTVRAQQAVNEGWSAEVTDQVLKEHLTSLHKGIIEAKLDVDPRSAEAHFEKYKDQIQGRNHDAIRESLKVGSRLQQAQEFADEMAQKGVPEEEQRAEARKRFTGEAEKEAVAEVNRRVAEQQAAIARAQQAAFREADQIIFKGGVYNDIPNSLLSKLTPADRDKLRDQEYGNSTDWATYYGLRQLAAKDATRFARTDLTPYFGKLDPAKRAEIIKLQTAAQKDPADLKLGRTKDQVIKQAISAAGLDPKDLLKDNSSGEKARAFHRRIDDELIAHYQRTGKEASQAELIEITDSLAAKVVRERWYWWDSEVAAGVIDIEGVPKEQVPGLAEAVAAQGMDVTEDNIRALYEYHRERTSP